MCHILWSCLSAQDVWEECSVRIQKSHSSAIDFLSIMGSLIDKCSNEELQMAILAARLIWHRRNSLVFDGKFMSPQMLLQTAKDQLESFNAANQHVRPQGQGTRRELHIPWTKPSLGYIKVNWDAAIEGKRKRIIGVIVRDHERVVVAMMSGIVDFINDLVTTEALATRQAVEFSQTLGIRKLILEGDALKIIQALRVIEDGRSSYGLIIVDMLQLLHSFLEYKVNFVPWEANGEAYKLAKLALSLGETKVWRDDFPI
jgi:hypothetical protein